MQRQSTNRPQEGANAIDRTGGHYGRLTVLRRAGSKGTAAAWLCRCDCGQEKVITSNCLRAGYSRSCGCSRATGPGSRPSYTTQHVPGRSARNRVLKQYRGAARTRGLSWEISGEDFDALTASDCAYCGVAPSTISSPSGNGSFMYNGIDRVDNRLGYVPGNVVPCCPTCNHAKHTMTQAAFLAWIARLVAHATAHSSP